MSQSLPPNLIKATTGQYSISIRDIFAEGWHRVKGIKKSFFGGVVLFFLTVAGILLLATFLLFSICSVAHFCQVANVAYLILIGIFSVLVFLFSGSLIFLALQHLRCKTIEAKMVFEFRKAWKPLIVITFCFSLVCVLLGLMNKIVFSKLFTGGITGIFYVGLSIKNIITIILFSYILMLINMSMLLILDKKMSLQESFTIAFKSINKHVFKILALFLLADILYLCIIFITLGIGIIWVLPFKTLVVAILYRRIFCQDELGLVSP